MATNLFDLTGRIALVTGSSRGIGFAFAEAVCEAGGMVVLNGRDTGTLEKARAALPAGARSHIANFDVTDPGAVEKAITEIERDVGPIDILFNNAGIQRRGPMVDIDPAVWRDVLTTNIDAVFYVGQAVARRMIPRGRGKIVNTCSLTSELGRATIAPYTTAKGAVKMLTKAMCAEWAKHGIQANGIGPGYFKTELNKEIAADPAFDAWVKARTPAGRWGTVDELKGAAIFLASAASDFVNGQVIYVDGGILAVI